MRKLIRPTREELDKLKRQYTHTSIVARHRTPAVSPGEEVHYLQQHAEHKTPMLVKLANGEEIRGWIEYYDLHFIRLTVTGGPNRFVFKKDIVYMHEDLEAMRRRKIPHH